MALLLKVQSADVGLAANLSFLTSQPKRSGWSIQKGNLVIRIRAIINDLPPGEQARIAECVKRLVYLEREYGDSYKIALGLLAAELAAAPPHEEGR